MHLVSIHFVGTATTLLRLGGFTLLTDPNFLHRGERVYLGYGAHARRLTEPALQPEDLPALDGVLLSHLHEDHFDRVAERRLHLGLPVFTTPQAARSLQGKGFSATRPLRTWQDVVLRRGPEALRITAMPGRHGGPVVSRFMPQVMGSLLDLEIAGVRRLRLYVTGDTLVFRDLEEIPRRFPGIDLALLHLGGTRVAGVLLTMDGAEGVEAMRIVRPRLSIPIHFDDYDVFRSPLSDFRERVRAAGLERQVHYLARGDTFRWGEDVEVPAPGP